MSEDTDPGTSRMGRRRAAAQGGRAAGYAQRRTDIIEAAAHVFRSKGYRAATLADVAEAVGVDRATLYYYVGSKEELLDEIVSDVVRDNLAVAERIRDGDDPAPVKLRTLVTQLMSSYAEHYPFLYVYLQENLAQVSEKRRPWAVEMRGVNRRYEAAVEGIVLQGVAEGSLRPVTDPRVLAFGLMGMVSWTSRWFNPQRSELDADAIGQAYARVLLGGLEVRPGDDPEEPAPARRTPVPHPDVVRLAARFAEAGVPTYDTVSVLRARSLLEGVTRLQRPAPPVAEVRDLLLDGSAGLLPARLYHPEPGRAVPLVVYLHGGGWVLGSVRAADEPCRALAAASGCAVLSVDYRLAPETRFPGPLEDCVAAVRWVAAHRAELGGDDRLVLLGDSAGGNLVAATCLVLRDAGDPLPDAQVLLYPALAPARGSTSPSMTEQAAGPLLTRGEMEWFWDHYLRTDEDASDPRAAPLLAPDLSGLPPATVVVCELDPLRDEGLAFAERLRAAGVPTDLRVVEGAAHGFWWMDAEMEQAVELTQALGPVLRG